MHQIGSSLLGTAGARDFIEHEAGKTISRTTHGQIYPNSSSQQLKLDGCIILGTYKSTLLVLALESGGGREPGPPRQEKHGKFTVPFCALKSLVLPIGGYTECVLCMDEMGMCCTWPETDTSGARWHASTRDFVTIEQASE